MKRREFNKAMLAALGGIAAGIGCGENQDASGPGATDGAAKAAGEMGLPKHACKGRNDCKGQGGCKSGDAGCAGKNSCSGKGGCATVEPHSCRGKNECKSLGGCGSGDNGCKAKNSCAGKGGCAVPIKH